MRDSWNVRSKLPSHPNFSITKNNGGWGTEWNAFATSNLHTNLSLHSDFGAVTACIKFILHCLGVSLNCMLVFVQTLHDVICEPPACYLHKRQTGLTNMGLHLTASVANPFL